MAFYQWMKNIYRDEKMASKRRQQDAKWPPGDAKWPREQPERYSCCSQWICESTCHMWGVRVWFSSYQDSTDTQCTHSSQYISTLIKVLIVSCSYMDPQQSRRPSPAAQVCSASRASLAFRGNRLGPVSQLRPQKINIHCVSVTLYEYLSQSEAQRDREACNQYLLALPSEELDFTIRSACSPDSTSNIISWLSLSRTDVTG